MDHIFTKGYTDTQLPCHMAREPNLAGEPAVRGVAGSANFGTYPVVAGSVAAAKRNLDGSQIPR